MSKVVITYDTLYEILRREKFKKELQKLDDNFFDNTLNYLNDKSKIYESQKEKDSIFSSEFKKTEKTLENTKKILKELYEKRESKIIMLALFSSRTAPTEDDIIAMLPEEKRLYSTLLDDLTKFRKDILQNLLENKQPKVEGKSIKSENQDSKSLIRFLHAVPKFVGEDLTIYGPFDAHDVANLPKGIGFWKQRKNLQGRCKLMEKNWS